MAPIVQTVRGPVDPVDLGVTLIHEHLLIDLPVFVEPREEPGRTLAYAPFSLGTLGWIRRHWTSHRENLQYDDEALAIDEAREFAAAGGGTIVDATVPGIGRDPLALRRISEATGLHVVMGAGAYVAHTHPPGIADLDEHALAALVIAEWRDGVDGTGIRPGFLGETGCSWPLHERERVVLRGMARASAETGLALMIHPGRNPAAPLELMAIAVSAGADPSRILMAHLDRTVQDLDGLRQLADTGCWLEFDCFGLESSYYPFDPRMTTLSDAQRIELVRGLEDAGLGGRVVLAHDVCQRHRLTRYGGHGFGHLPRDVIPWMHQRGFTEAETTRYLVTNPAAALAVAST